MPIIRLDTFFSSQEIISRKDVKALVKKGNIKINGSPVRAFDEKLDTDKDKITLYDKEIPYKPYLYIMMNKPRGVLCVSSDKKQKTVLHLLPPSLFRSDLFPAGRLDKDTEGFVLITNDGEFAHSILSPKSHIEKKYVAVLDGVLTQEGIARIMSGITLADGDDCKPAEVRVINEESGCSTVEITLVEGKYHQIKRMFGVLDLGVDYLKRTHMGQLSLDTNLALSECREILDNEIKKISVK